MPSLVGSEMCIRDRIMTLRYIYNLAKVHEKIANCRFDFLQNKKIFLP